jgi:hypothetical protein
MWLLLVKRTAWQMVDIKFSCESGIRKFGLHTICDNLTPGMTTAYWVSQTCVPKQVWTCSNLRLHELQTLVPKQQQKFMWKNERQ